MSRLRIDVVELDDARSSDLPGAIRLVGVLKHLTGIENEVIGYLSPDDEAAVSPSVIRLDEARLRVLINDFNPGEGLVIRVEARVASLLDVLGVFFDLLRRRHTQSDEVLRARSDAPTQSVVCELEVLGNFLKQALRVGLLLSLIHI